MLWAAPAFALAATVGFGALLFGILGFDPAAALMAYFVEPVSTVWGLSELLVKAVPLTLCAVGISVGFRANVWNIGAEGQFVVGAIAGGGVALAFWGEESWWILPSMLLAGAAAGVAYASIPALLKTRFNASELLTSLMLVYVASLLLSYLVRGPWRDPQGFNFPQSRLFGSEATLVPILEGTRVTGSVWLAFLAVLGGWILVRLTPLGFQIRVAGLSPGAADYAGYSRNRLVWTSMAIGGGLAGLAGVAEVAGPIGQLTPTVSPGYGFTAIIVAFLGRLHPVGIAAAALVVALSYIGGEQAQVTIGLPLAVTGVFQGLLLFMLLAADVLVRYRVEASSPLRREPAR